MTDKHVQYIALFLIILATICIGVGEKNNWIHLVDFANMFGGGGVGILTGKQLSNVSNKGDGAITVNPTA